MILSLHKIGVKLIVATKDSINNIIMSIKD